MLTIHARNNYEEVSIYKKPVRSFQNWTKSQNNLLKKAIFYLYLRSAVKSIPFKPVLKGWVQKMRTEEEKRAKGKRREKKRKKEVKMGIKIFFLFLFL